MTVRVFATVGSDHHRFDRLVCGLDEWAGARPDVELYVQHGTAQRPTNGDGSPYLPHRELLAHIGHADIVVSQGAPAGITEIQRAGLRPIVMPRMRAHGEAVDDHQVSFCRYFADTGGIWLVENRGELVDGLDRLLRDPLSRKYIGLDREEIVASSAARFGELVAVLGAETGQGPQWLRSPGMRRFASWFGLLGARAESTKMDRARP